MDTILNILALVWGALLLIVLAVLLIGIALVGAILLLPLLIIAAVFW